MLYDLYKKILNNILLKKVLPLRTDKTVKTKIETVLKKNEGYKPMVKMSKILFGDEERLEGVYSKNHPYFKF
jgi:hypothetical protein